MVFVPDYPIETERLLLRPFTRGDLDEVFAYRSRADVCRYLFDEPMTRETCAETIQARVGQLSLEQDGDRIVLAVVVRETVELVGEVSLILRSADARQGEIGYILHPRAQGHGYATEAAGALLRLGFEGARMHRIHARCHAPNLPSARVMERLGMRREAHFRHHALTKGTWDEEFIYAILDDEWRATIASDLRHPAAATS